MDDSVIRAIAKWPNVPAVHGWLSLSRRGDWLINGERIAHRAACAFINRNYGCDDNGCWYFQNGPQRVYVSLEYTPWVVSLNGAEKLATHTGNTIASPEGVWLDDEGSLLVLTEFGIGVIDDRDLNAFSLRLWHANGSANPDLVEQAISETQSGRAGNLKLKLQDRVLPVDCIKRTLVAGLFGFNSTPMAGDQ